MMMMKMILMFQAVPPEHLPSEMKPSESQSRMLPLCSVDSYFSKISIENLS